MSWRVDDGPPGDPKGRRVIALRAFQPGDAVLRDVPYACVLYDDQLASRCDCCLEPGTSLLRCAGCKLAHYKGRDHQRRAWKAGHREECAALRQLAPRVPPPTVRLAARAALQRHRTSAAAADSTAGGTTDGTSGASGGSGWGGASCGGAAGGGAGTSSAAGSGGARGGEIVGDRWAEVLSLQHHWEETPNGLKVRYAQMGALAWQVVQLASPEAAEAASPRDLALLIARFACNNHTICDGELRPVGVGIYPLVSLVNHSCTPNCMQSFQGSTLVLRAVRPIAPGDEVTITYVELGATRWERRVNLLSQYYFDIDRPFMPGGRTREEAGAAQPLPGQAACTAAAPGSAGTAAAAGAAQGAQAGGEEAHLQASQDLQVNAAGSAGSAGEAPAPDSQQLQAGTAGSAGEAPGPVRVEDLAGGVQLRLYCCPVPPWPYDDPRDLHLTAVRWGGAGGEVLGGIWGEFESFPSSAHSGGSTLSEALGWGDAAESFPVEAEDDGEGEGVWQGGGEAEGRLGSEVPQAASFRLHAKGSNSDARGSAAPPDTSTTTTSSSSRSSSSRSSSSRSSSNRGQVIVHCWRPQGWGEDPAAVRAAAELAGAYAQALSSLGAAEELLLGGSTRGVRSHEEAATEAARKLERALAAACGGPRSQRSVRPSGAPWLQADPTVLDHAIPAPAAAAAPAGGVGSVGEGAAAKGASSAEGAAPAAAVARQVGAASATTPLVLGPLHVLRMRLLAAAVRAAVAAGDRWEQSLGWMYELLPLYEFAYPQVWPNLGLHWAGIAKLEHFLGGRAQHAMRCVQQAQHAARRALAILGCTHSGSTGGGSGGAEGLGEEDVVEATRRVLFEAGRELAELNG